MLELESNTCVVDTEVVAPLRMVQLYLALLERLIAARLKALPFHPFRAWEIFNSAC